MGGWRRGFRGNRASGRREASHTCSALWLAWLLYWAISARDVKATRWREPLESQLLHRVPVILAVVLLAVPRWHVRHPIYAGILLAVLGTAVTIGEWRAILAVPLALLAFVWKSRAEEGRMRQSGRVERVTWPRAVSLRQARRSGPVAHSLIGGPA